MLYDTTVVVTTFYRKTIEAESEAIINEIVSDAFCYDGFDETWSVDESADVYVDKRR